MATETFLLLVFAGAIGAAVTVAGVAVTYARIEVGIARRALCFAWACGICLCVWYGATNSMDRVWRYSIGSAVAAISTIILMAAIDWVRLREGSELTASTTLTSSSQPPSLAVAPSAPVHLIRSLVNGFPDLVISPSSVNNIRQILGFELRVTNGGPDTIRLKMSSSSLLLPGGPDLATGEGDGYFLGPGQSYLLTASYPVGVDMKKLLETIKVEFVLKYDTVPPTGERTSVQKYDMVPQGNEQSISWTTRGVGRSEE